jgi:hypothetical protein
MLRIECSCGKTLKVSDEQVGKKVRCPECDELIPVRRSSAVSAKPMRGRAADDDDDVVDEEPAKKSKTGCILAVAGVFLLLLFLVVAGGGVAAYFIWFKDKPADTAGGGGGGGGGEPPPKADPIAIRLQQPRKKGDVREVILKADLQTIGGALPGGNGKGDVACKIKTLAADSVSGQETAWEVTIKNFSAPNPLGIQEAPFQPGTVLIGKLTSQPNRRGITWTFKSNNAPVMSGIDWLGKACGREFLGSNSYVDDDDFLFGTKEKQAVGGTWAGNSTEMTRILNIGVPGNATEISAVNGKLASVTGDGPAKQAEVEINADAIVDSSKAPGSPFATKGTATLKFNYQFPVEQAKGPTKVTFALDAKIEMSSPANPNMSFNVTHTETTTLDIKYLPPEDFEEIVKGPDPKEKEKEKDKTPPPQPFSAQLSNPQAKWMQGADNNTFDIVVSADYNVLSGKANIASQYALVLNYTNANNKVDSYKVESKGGGSLNFTPKGKFSGTVKGVAMPKSLPNQTCELVLTEAPSSDPNKQTNVHTLQFVVIVGAPIQRPQFELTNEKVENSGKQFKFSVDYKVISGQLDPNANYSLQVEISGGKLLKNPIKDLVVSKRGNELQQSGTLTIAKDFPQDPGQNLSYVLRIIEDKGGSTNTVSMRDKNGFVTTTEATMPAGKLKADLNAAVQIQGKQPYLAVQWKFSDKPDPAATYQFEYELRGGKGKNTGFIPVGQPVAGGQLKMQDSTNWPIMIQGQNTFEVILVEYNQANPKGHKIGQFTGK